jgi:hypothetical protein
MRTIRILTTSLALVILLAACEKTDHSYQGKPFVSFGMEEAKVFKNGSTVNVPVMIADDRSEQVTVTFEVKPRKADNGDDIVEGVDFIVENESTTLTFEPGEGKKYIKIKPIDDYTFTGDKKIDIAITSNSKNYQMGVPGPDGKFKQCVVVIRESNCPFDPTQWEGLIKGSEEATTGGWWKNADSPSKWEFVEESSENIFVFKVSGFLYAQCVSSDWAWYSTGEVEFLPVHVTINLSNPASPTYSLAPDKAFEDIDGWGAYAKEVINAPLLVDICGKYLEIPYTVTGTSWAHNYIFTIKYQF